MTNSLTAHLPFTYRETPAGRRVSFRKLCAIAKLDIAVTAPQYPDIRYHHGDQDFIAARPGQRIYCLAFSRLPSGASQRARHVIERIGYGDNNWIARAVLSADRTRRLHPPETEAQRKHHAVTRQTLALRRLLRKQPFITSEEAARILNQPLADVIEQFRIVGAMPA